MHCELVVPALIPRSREASGSERLPALELLLARGRAVPGERRSLERWLCDEFGLEQDVLPAGALSLLGVGEEPGTDLWLRADPVHLRLMRDELRLIPGDGFTLSRAEADALCSALNEHFRGELDLRALQPERWCARVAGGGTPLETPAPLEIAGANVDAHLPAGPGGARWRTLLNEAQMLLYTHPVNDARELRGEPEVNSVWLWGAGRCPATVEARWHSLVAGDPLALGLGKRAGLRAGPLPASAEEWLAQLPADGRHLAVLDGLRAPAGLGDAEAFSARLQAFEAYWFAPLLGALRAGRIGMLSVHVPDVDEALSFEAVRGDLRRFWRRPRAVGDYA